MLLSARTYSCEYSSTSPHLLIRLRKLQSHPETLRGVCFSLSPSAHQSIEAELDFWSISNSVFHLLLSLTVFQTTYLGGLLITIEGAGIEFSRISYKRNHEPSNFLWRLFDADLDISIHVRIFTASLIGITDLPDHI